MGTEFETATKEFYSRLAQMLPGYTIRPARVLGSAEEECVVSVIAPDGASVTEGFSRRSDGWHYIEGMLDHESPATSFEAVLARIDKDVSGLRSRAHHELGEVVNACLAAQPLSAPR